MYDRSLVVPKGTRALVATVTASGSGGATPFVSDVTGLAPGEARDVLFDIDDHPTKLDLSGVVWFGGRPDSSSLRFRAFDASNRELANQYVTLDPSVADGGYATQLLLPGTTTLVKLELSVARYDVGFVGGYGIDAAVVPEQTNSFVWDNEYTLVRVNGTALRDGAPVQPVYDEDGNLLVPGLDHLTFHEEWSSPIWSGGGEVDADVDFDGSFRLVRAIDARATSVTWTTVDLPGGQRTITIPITPLAFEDHPWNINITTAAVERPFELTLDVHEGGVPMGTVFEFSDIDVVLTSYRFDKNEYAQNPPYELLDSQRRTLERGQTLVEALIPVATNLMTLSVELPNGETLVRSWFVAEDTDGITRLTYSFDLTHQLHVGGQLKFDEPAAGEPACPRQHLPDVLHDRHLRGRAERSPPARSVVDVARCVERRDGAAGARSRHRSVRLRRVGVG